MPTLAGATLIGVFLAEANLGNARLGRANLAGAVLDGADLSATDLGGAVLVRASLHFWVGSEAERKALLALAEGVPGVARVADEMMAAY